RKGTSPVLKNWWPIALINTNAKVFTRILNAQIIHTSNSFNHYKTGFVKGQFIVDSEIMTRMAIEYTQNTSDTSIGLMVDQEISYDRVRPEY
ncbi:hypothetical protein PHYBLDRAFT_102412, partial [Phycomyces blakesleeanus NRRL 1555(-)]